MAKLIGVKTIDMVNGEITKVAYDGAEYVAVEGNGKVGDLAQCVRATPFFTIGEFYEVTAISVGGKDVHAIDDEGDRYYMYVNSIKLFRKISDTSPTIEERVSALESDVAALKGEKADETIEFEGATYRKVDREAREGVVVVLTGDDLPEWFTKGKAYAINAEGAIDTCDHGEYSYDVYSVKYGRTRETVDVYEPIEKAVKDANKPKLKAGDYIKITRVRSYYDNTKVYEVVEKCGKLCVIDEDGDFNGGAIADGKYEIVDAETAKWSKIGREVNEFKKGDSVFVTHPDGGKIYGIIHEDSCGHKIKVDFGKQYRVCTEKKIDLTLVAPDESTLN